MSPFCLLAALSSLTVFTSRAMVLFFSTVTRSRNRHRKAKCNVHAQKKAACVDA